MANDSGNKGFLAFFGMESVGRTCETLSCLLPIVAIMVLALGIISYLFAWAGLVTLTLGKYAIAIGIAVAVSFFTLARLRVMNLSSGEDEESEAD